MERLHFMATTVRSPQNETKRSPNGFEKSSDPLVKHEITDSTLEGDVYAKFKQPKGGRVQLQLQKAVDAEFQNLLKPGHIEQIDKVIDERNIQPASGYNNSEVSNLRYLPDRSIMTYWKISTNCRT